MTHPLLRAHRALTLWRLRRAVAAALPDLSVVPVPGRLLYVAASCLPYHVSGYTARTHELLHALRAAGADLRVLTRPGYPWDREDRLHAPHYVTRLDDIQYAHFDHPPNLWPTALYVPAAARAIERYARWHKVARIHAASNHVNALPALIAARRLGIPFQYEMRGLWELTRVSRMPEFAASPLCRLGLDLEGLTATHADRLFVISEQLAAWAQREWGIPAERIRLLPNCVDGGRIRPLPDVPVEPGLIGYAGSLIGYEGLDTLLDAVAVLRQRGIAARLHVIGDGEARPALEAQARGLEDRVRFFGRVAPEKAREHLARCALVCVPRKPFEVCRIVPPLKLAEAQALGKPVVVPDLPVFRDELGPEPAGWFFRAGDAAHLAEVLAEALANPGRLAAVGERGRRHVLERRQWRHFCTEVLHCSESGEGRDA